MARGDSFGAYGIGDDYEKLMINCHELGFAEGNMWFIWVYFLCMSE